MTKRFHFILGTATCLLVGAQALAQSSGTSESVAPSAPIKKALLEEKWGLSAQLGTMAYRSNTEGSRNKATYGALFEYNVNNGDRGNLSSVFVGPVVGVLYSRLGRVGADFSGANGNVGDQDAYAVIVPANIKLGYDFSNSFRLSAHGGVNAVYRSVANRMNLGTTEDNTAHWDFMPNLGADGDVALGDNVAVTIRPDYTFTSGDVIFTGTLGLLVAFK